ncbi:sensor histidine kinase [Roseateles paludis]|uniref:histidine kinase n=1 Tax=Roseateles paludis TaxID=3145238 RepID=A0ABV0FZE8_9BURK
MALPQTLPSPTPARLRPGWGWRRALPWVALLALLVVAQSLLLALTVSHEAGKAQDQAEQVAAEVAGQIRKQVSQSLGLLQFAADRPAAAPAWQDSPALVRMEWRGVHRQLTQAVNNPRQLPPLPHSGPEGLVPETELACASALRQGSAQISRSYFVPLAPGLGLEVADLCAARLHGGEPDGFVIATLALRTLLEAALLDEHARGYEVSLVEADNTRLARAGLKHGRGVYVFQRLVDLPGQSFQLRVDSVAGAPSWVPNLPIALVMGLTLALFGMVVLLARDGRRRAGVEAALAESLTVRQAMENSLVTGLRARDAEGRVTYVNPAFCRMVGLPAGEILGRWPPPYWPPEHVENYLRRNAERRARWAEGDAHAADQQTDQQAEQGFETVFMRQSGERFPVRIYEAPLRDAHGRQTGLMSTVLDISEQRRVEELSRQQQDRLQATARLATVGEMASLLSHELNQPLAAIASYANGSLNLLADPEPPEDTPGLVRQALERIAAQADRAGRVIKSVHDFVRRREHLRENIDVATLLEAVLPLIRLQARKGGSQVVLDLPAERLKVRCDRTMVEQVLLNLSRNGLQAMENAAPGTPRELRLAARLRAERWVELSVRDHGPGIPSEVAKQLFTPFFTTRGEGMGLGLSLCRTVIEQHGGALDFENLAAAQGGGCEFRFTLPIATPGGAT